MKKIILLIPLFMLMGCTEKNEMPKLHAKTINIDCTEKINLTYDELIDTSELSEEQLEELEKNGDINTSNLIYDANGYLIAGVYDVEVCYYEDVVDCVITVTDSTLPVFNDVDEIEVPLSWIDYDFNQNIAVVSPIGLPIELSFDTSTIDFYTLGDYNLVAIATDSNGKSVTKNITVHIV